MTDMLDDPDDLAILEGVLGHRGRVGGTNSLHLQISAESLSSS